MKKRILAALDFLDKIEDWFLVVMLGVMVLLAVVQIFYRNVFGIGLLWADPMLRIMVLWVALAGAVIATRTDPYPNRFLYAPHAKNNQLVCAPAGLCFFGFCLSIDRLAFISVCCVRI